MPMPGAGDPYFYEWYVGLENVIKMLNPDSGIEHVIFQHDEYDTIDDVVVTYANGNKQVCYQVKHNIETAAPNSLTFGSMLEASKGKKCLFEAMFEGWKKALTSSTTITPILFSNRRILDHRAGRRLNGQLYSAYPIDKFISKMHAIIEEQGVETDLVIADKALSYQWEELYNTLSNIDRKELLLFLKDFHVEGNQLSLSEMKNSLLTLLSQTFVCNDGMAQELFSKLLFGLSEWTTTGRQQREVTLEDAYSVLAFEADVDDSQHRLAHPYPFFESRKSFCDRLVEQIQATKNKVVFISGNPGSGKTSVVSFLQSEYNLFSLRYHTFRPISPEQRFYNTDPGMCTTENLWGTLLTQLRKRLKGRLGELGVPVSNKLIPVDKLREQVIRLLKILAQEAAKEKKRVYVCIDGIDHAARANTEVSFLNSLPTPEEIPEGVCFIIVGQPITMYQDRYPIWLSTNCDIERIDMPLLNTCDIEQLILSHANQFKNSANELATLIFQKTEGNNLSAVFAVEEIRSVHSIEDAVAKLQQSGVCGNIQQYYNNIWGYMKKDLASVIRIPTYPESIIACPLLLMNGRVNTRILAQALPYGMSQEDWSMVLDRLFPLIVRTEAEGEYTLFHNDFRVYLMGIIHAYQARYKQIALALAEYLLQNNEGLLSYTMGIPLLQCAERQDLVPQYFTPEFVIDALAEGISKTRLDEFAHLSYSTACAKKDYTGYRNTYFAIKTLHQHIRYYEYYEKRYRSTDYPEISAVHISEIQARSIAIENIDAFSDVLARCVKLYSSEKEDYKKRALALYHKWFDGYSPLSFVPFLPDSISEENAWEIKTSEIGLFLQHWGRVAAELMIPLPQIEEEMSVVDLYVLVSFGNSYFAYCIENQRYQFAKEAIKAGYVAKQALSEKLEDIYYANVAHEFDKALSQVEQDEEEPAFNLLACSMRISFDSSYIPDRSVLESSPTVKHVHDKACFTLILKAFLLGRIEWLAEDEKLIELSDQYCSDIEGSTTEKSQASYLARVAALLGKYYWNSDPHSTMLEGYLEWLLTANLSRSFDYSKARRFLLFTTLHSQAMCSVGKTDSFITALRKSLFETDLLGMFYKTDMLDFLVKQNQLGIVKEYIDALYGENCSQISKDELKADTHKHFQTYGDLVNPELMAQFTAQLKWDVVGYLGYKEYAMYAPLECYNSIIKSSPGKWRELGKHLYQQSKVADLANNQASYEIDRSLTKAAAACGISDYWELREWGNVFKFKPDQIYQSLFEFINVSKKAEDLKAIWILCCGIHSWYTQSEKQGVKCIYDACLKKSAELDFKFALFVSQLTPHWMSIIMHLEQKSADLSEHSEYGVQKAKEIEGMQSFHGAISVDESLDFLKTVEHERWVDEHYNIVLSKILQCGEEPREKLSKLLGSIQFYLRGKSWTHERFDTIITTLLSTLYDEAFWALAESIYSQLSDYDYQTSTQNMQLLFKLKSDLNCAEAESLLYEELRVQKLWATGNHHFDIDFNEEGAEKTFENMPSSLAEMAFYILLEQINTQNARKMESAIYALSLLGSQFPKIMDIIVERWACLSQNQEECLLIVIAKWAVSGVCSEGLGLFLRDMYVNCAELTRKYYLHSILLKLQDPSVQSDVILFDAPLNGYKLPNDGIAETMSCYENFLSAVENHADDTDIDAIRKYLFEVSPLESYVNDPYAEDGDTRLPTVNMLPGNIFYDKEKTEEWDSIPLTIKKARLLPIEDPCLLTEMPRMSFDEKWFPQVSVVHDGKPHEYLTPSALHNIVNYNVGDNEIVLAASLWYPWGYKDGTIYIQSSKIGVPHDALMDKEFDRCVGNFGLLTNEDAIDESCVSEIGSGGASLFNRVCGNFKLYFGNCQLAPSSVWRDCFACEPLENNPYIWINQNGEEVLRFERVASPVRELMREPYIRQPILFRWICDKEWLKNMLQTMGLILFPICLQKKYPVLMEQ